MNVDMAPFDDEQVRQAVALAIDRDRLVENFLSRVVRWRRPSSCPRRSPVRRRLHRLRAQPGRGQEPADPGRVPERLRRHVELSRRRARLPVPARPGGERHRRQLAEVGIRVTVEPQESTTFIDAATAGELPFYLLGWGADYPDATNFLDFHFGPAYAGFGTPFEDIGEPARRGRVDRRPGRARHAVRRGGRAARPAHADGPSGPRRLGHGLPGDGHRAPGQPVVERAVRGHERRGRGAVRVGAERRAGRALLRRRERRRVAAGLSSRSTRRCSATRSTVPRWSRSWPRATSPTTT